MSIAPVVIEVLVKGRPQVEQSFRGIADAALRSERQMQREAERAAKERVRIAQKEERDRVRAAQQQARAEGQAWNATVRDVARLEREKTREAERAGRERSRLLERELAEKTRLEERAAANMNRIRERSATMAGRFAAQQARQESRDSIETGRFRARLAANVIGIGAQGVAAGMQRTAQTTLGLATTAASLGGGFSIADAMHKEVNLRGMAANLAASSMPGADGKKVTADDILKSAKATGLARSMDTVEVLEGVGKFKDLTGDTGRALTLMPKIAKLANAFGANAGELAENAGNIVMGDKSGTMTDDDVMKLLRVQTMQGAVGAVELKDMAKHGARLTAGASLFGGDRATNIATMSAFAQVARQSGGAASPAEAALAAQRFATDVQKHATDLEAKGIKVKDGKGGLRDAREIVKQMVEKSGGDVTKLGQFGLGERGIRVLTGFSDIYRQAGGGATGMAAVNKELAKYTTGVTESDIEQREKERLGEVDKQLAVAMLELRTVAGEKLLPEFVKMIPAIKEMIPLWIDAAKTGIPAFTELMKTVSDFVKTHKGSLEFLAANPIGALIGFEITKSFASAALPALLQKLMTAMFVPNAGASVASTAASAGVPGAAGAAGAGAGALGAVAGGALLQAGLLTNIYSETTDARAAGRARGTALSAELAAGSPEAQAELARAREQGSGLNVFSAWADRGTKVMSALVNPIGAATGYLGDKALEAGGVGSGSQVATNALKAEQLVDTVELQRVTTQAIANGVREGVAQGSSGPNGSARTESVINR